MGSVISVAGIVFLFLLGSFYSFRLEQLIAGHSPIKDPSVVARGCYTAAFIYMGVFVFCYFQVSGLFFTSGKTTGDEPLIGTGSNLSLSVFEKDRITMFISRNAHYRLSHFRSG